MSAPAKLERAWLKELDADFRNEVNTDKHVQVQFNPESLKVSYANSIQTPSGTGDQRGPQSRQFVGAGTTKLALMLWFDVNALPDDQAGTTDVRRLTQKVAYYITPAQTTDSPPKFVPPAVRFLWGTFQFDGLVEAMEETLELFSSDGRPLRASVSLTVSQQRITEFAFAGSGSGGRKGPSGGPPGTRPLSQAPQGGNLSSMAGQAGKGSDWQSIAAANGIEDPLRLKPGTLIDLNVDTRSGRR